MKHWYWIEGLRSKEELETLIAEEGSVNRIAKRIGCTRSSVEKAMRHYVLSRKDYVTNEEMRQKLNLN